MTSKKLYRDEEELVIAGVCGGLADYFDVDVTLIRAIFLILGIFGGGGLLIYVILWVIVPTKNDGAIIEDKEKINNFVKDVSKKGKTMAKEIKKEIKVEKNKTSKRSGSFLGLILMIFGTLFLIEKIIPVIIRWDYVWPVLLIVLGAYLIFRE